MARLDFATIGGVWSPETVPGAQHYFKLDDNQFRSVNGDAPGGFWFPTKPIYIGGAGLALTTSGSLSTGGVATKTGGRVVVSAAAGDFPGLSPSRSRTIEIPVLSTAKTDPTFGSAPPVVVLGPTKMGIQPATSGSLLFFDVPSRYTHGGGRIATIGMRYVVLSRPTSLPTPASLSVIPYSVQGDALPCTPTILQGDSGVSGACATWAPSTAFSVSTERVIPTIHVPNGSIYGYFYYPTTGGTTGSTEPAWPTTIGGTVTDGSVVWTCEGSLLPYLAPQWLASRVYPVGTYTNPTFAHNSGLYFRATTGGTSAGTEPTWPTTIGATVTDGSIVWTCIGHNGLASTVGQTVDVYYANGDSKTLQFNFDGSGTGGGNNICDVTFTRLQVLLGNPDPNTLITSLFATFDTITDMRFE